MLFRWMSSGKDPTNTSKSKPKTESLATPTASENAQSRIVELPRAERLLHAIIQGTAATTGSRFFRSLVKHLAEGLHVRFAFVAECLPNLRARSLAFFKDSDFGQD